MTATVLLRTPAHIEIQTVVGRELPGTYKHAPSACELPSGNILLVYCCGSGEYETDPAIWAISWDSQTLTWGAPRIVASEPKKAVANPAIWRDPNGHIFLFYVVRHGATWSTATLRAKRSLDEGQTWLNVSLPFDTQPMMTRCRPISLSDGTYLLPVYYEAGTDTEFLPPETHSFFLRYHPRSGKWIPTSGIFSRFGNLQPAVAEVEEGRLVAYCRRGGGYEGQENGWIVRSESHDAGRTWSPGKDSSFPNPNSAVDFLKLTNGHLLLAYNDSMVDRSPLSVALSTDHDHSYLFKREIISGGLKDFAYPCILQTADGKIHLFFSADGRACIKHAAFDEGDILR